MWRYTINPHTYLAGFAVFYNSVLTLQVSTASLPHDCGPCEIKVVFIHTWFASYLRLRLVALGEHTPKWLNQRQGIGTTSGDFLKHPILVWVCAEQSFWLSFVNRFKVAYRSVLVSFYITTTCCLFARPSWFLLQCKFLLTTILGSWLISQPYVPSYRGFLFGKPTEGSCLLILVSRMWSKL